MDKELKMKVLEMMKKELKEIGVDSWGLFKVVFLVENIFRMMTVNGKDEEGGVEEGEGKGDDGVREEEDSEWVDSK